MSASAQPSIDSLKIIDTDAHMTEPHDLWTARAPAAYKERLPHVIEVDGTPQWVADGEHVFAAAVPASVISKQGDKVLGADFMSWRIEEIHESSYDVKARVAVMDETGIYCQILYPNVAGFGSQRFLAIEDVELRNLCVTLYNDAMADVQSESEGRLLPMALMPWWDIDAAAREAERAHGMGLRGILMCSDPDVAGFPDLGEPVWDPLWRACNDLQMPVNFHIGASDKGFNMFGNAPWPSMGTQQRLALGSANIFLDNARVIGNLLYSGVPARFPECKFVSVESGIGWIPFFLEALDHQLKETAPDEMRHLELLPSEYFRRQVYACFWFETNAPQSLIEQIGADNILFETDYPHPTCLYPNVQEHLAEALGGVDALTRRKVLQDNAAQLYKIDL